MTKAADECSQVEYERSHGDVLRISNRTLANALRMRESGMTYVAMAQHFGRSAHLMRVWCLRAKRRGL